MNCWICVLRHRFVCMSDVCMCVCSGTVTAPGIIAFTHLPDIKLNVFGYAMQRQLARQESTLLTAKIRRAHKLCFRVGFYVEILLALQVNVSLTVIGIQAGGINQHGNF